MNINLSQIIYWGVAALALLALAAPAPDIATMFVVIIIVGVLLTHWSDYASIITPAATAATGGKAA